jgi:hypothetical protein
VPDLKCINTFISLLERTHNPAIANHVIHFMYGFKHIPVPSHILAGGWVGGSMGAAPSAGYCFL